MKRYYVTSYGVGSMQFQIRLTGSKESFGIYDDLIEADKRCDQLNEELKNETLQS